MTTNEPKRGGRPPVPDRAEQRGISMPASVWKWLNENIPAGERSSFVEQAVRQAIEQRKAETSAESEETK